MNGRYASQPRNNGAGYQTYRNYLRVDDIEGAVPRLNQKYTGARPDIMLKRDFMEDQYASNKDQRDYLKRISQSSYNQNNHNQLRSQRLPPQLQNPPINNQNVEYPTQKIPEVRPNFEHKLEAFPRTFNPRYASAYMLEYQQRKNGEGNEERNGNAKLWEESLQQNHQMNQRSQIDSGHGSDKRTDILLEEHRQIQEAINKLNEQAQASQPNYTYSQEQNDHQFEYERNDQFGNHPQSPPQHIIGHMPIKNEVQPIQENSFQHLERQNYSPNAPIIHRRNSGLRSSRDGALSSQQGVGQSIVHGMSTQKLVPLKLNDLAKQRIDSVNNIGHQFLTERRNINEDSLEYKPIRGPGLAPTTEMGKNHQKIDESIHLRYSLDYGKNFPQSSRKEAFEADKYSFLNDIGKHRQVNKRAYGFNAITGSYMRKQSDQ